DSVEVPARRSRAPLLDIPVDREGIVEADGLAAALASTSQGRTLLTLQLANNETGVLQPVAEITRQAKRLGLVVHSDAVQAVGRVSVDVAKLGVDYLTLSAHKLGGPQGIGALVIRGDRALPAFLIGGGQ